MMRPIILASLLALAMTPPVDAVAFYHYGEGWCGGRAPIANACEAQPITAAHGMSFDLHAGIVCAVVLDCADGEVRVTATASTGTGSMTITCTYTARDNWCTGVTYLGTVFVGQEITVTGSAVLACPVSNCVGVPAAADWTVALS